MYIVPPSISPRQIVEDRIRTAELRDRIRIANAARCETDGCHPILEAMSTVIVAIGGWLNRRVAPPERRVRISISTHPARTTLPAC